jgi:hypothetical protein
VRTADGKLPAYQASTNTAAKGLEAAACGRRLDETQLSSVGNGRDRHDCIDGRCVRKEATRGARAAAGAAAGAGA